VSNSKDRELIPFISIPSYSRPLQRGIA